MSKFVSRGALIVLEGCDRSGKTTQCKMLVDALNSCGMKAAFMRFPDRETAIGKVINDYLERKCELEDHAVHLLFAANRWELVPQMKKLLSAGTTLIVDRYSFSGVAFSGAKENLGLDWCREPEVGLPKPDAVLYLTLSAEAAAERAAFGGERYEETNFQKRVAENYTKIQEDNWKTIDANKTIEDLHQQITQLAKDIIAEPREPVGALWVQSDQSEQSSTKNGISQNGTTLESPPSKKACMDRGEGVDGTTEVPS